MDIEVDYPTFLNRAITAGLAPNNPKRRERTAPLPVSSTWLPRVQAFRLSFNLQDKDWLEAERLKLDISTYQNQHPGAGLSLGLFDRIVTWKLEQQEKRTSHHRAKVTDDLVHKITACAFSLVHSDRNVLAKVRLKVLSALPGVCFWRSFCHPRTQLSR